MKKFNLGTVTNSRTGETENVEVEYPKIDRICDYVIGAMLVLTGLTYHWFLRDAYNRGAEDAMRNEQDALTKIGAIEGDERMAGYDREW